MGRLWTKAPFCREATAITALTLPVCGGAGAGAGEGAGKARRLPEVEPEDAGGVLPA